MVGAPRAGPQSHQAQACSGGGERASPTPVPPKSSPSTVPGPTLTCRGTSAAPRVVQPASRLQNGALRCRHQDPRPLNNPAPPPQLRPLGLSGTEAGRGRAARGGAGPCMGAGPCLGAGPRVSGSQPESRRGTAALRADPSADSSNSVATATHEACLILPAGEARLPTGHAPKSHNGKLLTREKRKIN